MAAAKTPRAAAKALANLARCRAAAAAAGEARELALRQGRSPAVASAAATSARSAVMRRPLTDFMTPEQRAAVTVEPSLTAPNRRLGSVGGRQSSGGGKPNSSGESRASRLRRTPTSPDPAHRETGPAARAYRPGAPGDGRALEPGPAAVGGRRRGAARAGLAG